MAARSSQRLNGELWVRVRSIRLMNGRIVADRRAFRSTIIVLVGGAYLRWMRLTGGGAQRPSAYDRRTEEEHCGDGEGVRPGAGTGGGHGCRTGVEGTYGVEASSRHRGEHRETKRSTDLLAGVEQSRCHPGVRTWDPCNRCGRDAHESTPHPGTDEQKRRQNDRVSSSGGNAHQQRQPRCRENEPNHEDGAGTDPTEDSAPTPALMTSMTERGR